MRKNCLALAIMLSALPFTAFAQEAEQEEASSSPFTWNAAVASEYLFRGISQTDDRPAIQLGADYSFSNGIYVGTWASNVHFGEGTDAEVDTYIGFNKDLSDTVNADLMLTRYNYVGEPDGVNYAYNELIGKIEFNEQYAVTLGYTNNFLNLDEDSLYVGVAGSWELGRDINLSASAGYTKSHGDLPSYADYSVGLDRNFGPINASLQYITTSGSAEEYFGVDNAEDKFVLMFSYGL